MHCFSLEWSYPCIAQLNHSKTSTIFRIHITARAMNEWMNEILMSRHEATGQFWPIWHWVGGVGYIAPPTRQTNCSGQGSETRNMRMRKIFHASIFPRSLSSTHLCRKLLRIFLPNCSAVENPPVPSLVGNFFFENSAVFICSAL